MLVYSVTSKYSLDAVIDFHQMIKVHNKDAKNVPIILVGNKNDLKEERQISFEGEQHEL